MQNPKWLNGRKVAIVTDWLTTYGGAEKVVATVSEIFPEAPIGFRKMMFGWAG